MTYAIPFGAAACASLLAVAAAAQDIPTLSTATAEGLGTYIVGPEGLPVYIFDTTARGGDFLPDIVSCKQDCRERWPPVTVAGDITVSSDLDLLLAAVVKDEALSIAVYDSKALFTYFRDIPGAPPTGHGIHTFGGWWYLIDPTGEPLDPGF